MAAKIPNAAAMMRTTIVSVGMGGSLCFSKAMMLEARGEALILVKFRAHPSPPLPAGEPDHVKFAALHALTAAPAGLH